MEIDINVYNLVNILLQVILWSLIISAPAIILTIEMYAYEKYLKWKNTEVQDKEKIIVGKAKQITKADEQLERQSNEIKKSNLEIELLERRKKAYKKELGLEVEEKKEDDESKPIDLESMTIIELKDIAKNKGLKMYSKKNKKQLIKLLNPMVISGDEK